MSTAVGPKPYWVVPEKVKTAEDLRARGMILGVARDDGGRIWLEFSSGRAGVSPLLAAIERVAVDGERARWKVEHSCSTLRESKGTCWHLGAAVMVAREQFRLPPLRHADAVEVVLQHPTPPERMEDVTGDVLGHRYNGSLLTDKLTLPKGSTAPGVEMWTLGDDTPGGGGSSTPASGGAPGAEERGTRSEAPAAAGGSDEVIRYLVQEGVSAELARAASAARRRDVPPHLQARIPPAPRFHGNPDALALAVASFIQRKNLLLVGPKSSGKTTLVYTLAWVFGLPLFEVPGNLETRVEDLRGDKTLEIDPLTGQTAVQYALGPVAEAMEVGGLAYVDEFPNIREGVAIWLNGLDWRRSVEVPGYGVIRAHPAFRLALAGNKGYAGTFTPNEATVDRTVVIELGYTAVAELVLRESQNKNPALAEKLQDLFKRLAAAVEHREIQTAAPLTVRGLVDAADLILLGIPPRVALRATVLHKIWEDDLAGDREKVAQLIDAIFA